VDSEGNAYVTGETFSPDFPLVNPLPNVPQGGAFVSKLSFDPETSTLSLAYSTLLGGSFGASGSGIAVDSEGNAYVTGSASSAGFPLVDSLPTMPLGGLDVFVSKLSFDPEASTLSLAYSTLLGGASRDVGSAIAVDSGGNAYVTGSTLSPDFPTVNPLPAPNNVLQNGEDAFVAKIGADENPFNAAP
jgi:beta-propeller repeat-containing protein